MAEASDRDDSAEAVPDPAGRGTLTLGDGVLARVAEIAALQSAHVSRHSRGLDRVTGRSLPRVEVFEAGERVRAAVEVSVRWPVPLGEAAADVRDGVSAALTHAAGVVVDTVDVTISHVAYADVAPRRRVL